MQRRRGVGCMGVFGGRRGSRGFSRVWKKRGLKVEGCVVCFAVLAYGFIWFCSVCMAKGNGGRDKAHHLRHLYGVFRREMKRGNKKGWKTEGRKGKRVGKLSLLLLLFFGRNYKEG